MPKLSEVMCADALYGTGARKSAMDAVAALKAKQENLNDLLQAFHNNGIWVVPTSGKYKGRPCWVEELMLMNGDGVYAFIRIPSLKGGNERVDDHYNQHVYLTNCDFVRPEPRGIGPTYEFNVPRFKEKRPGPNDKPIGNVVLQINMKEFLK